MKLIWKIVAIVIIISIPLTLCFIIKVKDIVQWLWVDPLHDIKAIWITNETLDWNDLFHTFFPLHGILNIVFLLIGVTFFILYYRTEKEYYWMKIVGIIGLFPLVAPFFFMLITLVFAFLSVMLDIVILSIRMLLPIIYLIAGICFLKNVVFDQTNIKT